MDIQETSKQTRDQNEVQIRYESGRTELLSSIADARKAFLKDYSIWKVSFDEKRFMPIRISDLRKWSEMCQQKIKELCPRMEFLQKTDFIWIHQALFPPDYKLGEFPDEMYYARCIIEVLTDDQFISTYCQ